MFFMYTCYLNELWTIDIRFPNSHIMARVQINNAIKGFQKRQLNINSNFLSMNFILVYSMIFSSELN